MYGIDFRKREKYVALKKRKKNNNTEENELTKKTQKYLIP